MIFLGFLTLESRAQSLSSQLKKIQELQDRAAYDSARILANQLLFSGELSTEERLRILISKQFSFYYLGQYDSLRAGLPVLEKDIEEEDALYPELLIVRGLQKGEDALYVDAIGDFLEAEKRMIAAKNPEYLGMIYNSLAGNFKDLDDMPSAKAYYGRAKKAFDGQGDKRAVVMVYNNLGAIYRKVNLLDSALYVYGEARKLLVTLNNSFLLAQNTLNMGNVYEQKGDLDQAEAAFLRCLELSESSKLQYGVLLSTLNLGNLYRLKKDFPRSKDWLNRALQLSNSMGLVREKGLGTDPLKADTDGDGVPDGVEVTDGTDPLDASKYKDTDGDLVPNFVEAANGTATGDSLNYKDSDKDGVPDYIELRDGTNPNSATSFKDTDGGGVPDYVEVTLFPNLGLAATNATQRGDDEQDTDGDGVPDYQEVLVGDSPKDASDFLDTDGDGVPDFVELKQGTNPNNPKDAKDSDGDGVPDHVQVRSIQLSVLKQVTLAWGTKNHLAQLPTTVEVGIYSGEKTNFEVVWNKTETLNILKRGTYELKGTIVLPKGYYNPYLVNGVVRVVVLPKPAPRDVTINNNTFVGSTTQFFIPVGSFVVNDPVDNIHVVNLNGPGYDNKYFYIENNILYWNSAERAPGKTKFNIIIRVTDRDGNTLDKFFDITRTRPDFNSLTIYNTFTPNGDRFNETWGVPEVRFYEGARIAVYERGGARVFYTENPDVRWDGTYNGKEMPVGSYYWVIQIEETGATRRGIVNLLRK